MTRPQRARSAPRGGLPPPPQHPPHHSHPLLTSSSETKEILTHTSTSIATESSAQQQFLRPLLKVVAVIVYGPSGTVETHALLDDGASASFIDLEIAGMLGVCGPEKQIRLDCVRAYVCMYVCVYVCMYVCL
jgi:hypothetical protein